MINTYFQLQKQSNYKLIQLPADVIEYIQTTDYEKNAGQLTLKSPSESSNELVLCSTDKTWKVRQMNHSNTVILLNDLRVNALEQHVDRDTTKGDANDSSMVGISDFSFEYELTRTDGYVNVDRVRHYPGEESHELHPTLAEIIDRSPIDKSHFMEQWYQLGGSEVDGKAVILDDGFVEEILSTLITVLISSDISCDSDEANIDLKQVAAQMQRHSGKMSKPVVKTILHKFGTKANGKYALNNASIAQYYGIRTLQKSATVPIEEKKFLLKWKSSFPAFYSVPMDVKQLQGHFCRPQAGSIQYLNGNSLAHEASARVKELFKIVPEWELEDFVPYIAQFVPKGKKPDVLVMKYTRKRRVGKKTLVGPR